MLLFAREGSVFSRGGISTAGNHLGTKFFQSCAQTVILNGFQTGIELLFF